MNYTFAEKTAAVFSPFISLSLGQIYAGVWEREILTSETVFFYLLMLDVAEDGNVHTLEMVTFKTKYCVISE